MSENGSKAASGAAPAGEAPGRAGSKPAGARLLVAMALASGITSVPNSAIVLALPTIHRQFDASLTSLEWTVTGYLLAYSALMIAAGRLADVFGRIRLLKWGTTIFAVASVPAALAPNAPILIAGMVGVGVGGAVLTPASLAIVTNSFRGPRRGLAVGVWGGASAMFQGVAPALGGLFTQEASWRWILWLNVIVGALILVGVRRAAESFDEEASRHIDITGVALSVTGLGALTLAFNEAPTPWAFGSAKFVLTVVAGVLLLSGFVLIERRLRDPLIDLSLFQRRNVTGATVVLFVVNFAFGAVLFFLPLYLQEQIGYGSLKAGLLLLPLSGLMMVAMPLGGRAYERFGPIPPIVGGMTMAAVAMVLLANVSTSSGYSKLWLPLVLLGFGVGTALTPLNLAALNATSVRNHGTVGGILAMVGGLGGTFGVALTGALFEQLQLRDIVSAASDRGLRLTRDAADTLAGLMSGTPSASHALAQYPSGQQAAVKAAVHEGFVSAFGGSMVLSFGLVLAAIVAALLLVRREPKAAALPRPNMTEPFSGLAPRP